MDEIQQKNDLLNAILASIQNHEYCSKREEKKKNATYKIMYIVWFIMLIFLAPRKKFRSKKMVCAITPVNEKILIPYMDNGEHFCFAKLNVSPRQMRVNDSVLSPYTLGTRILILFDGITFYIRFYKYLKGYLHFALEYYSIAKYIDDQCITLIIWPCMYNRYCTFLSYYAQSKGIELLGVQDGAAIDINVPFKIYCTKMYCFDEYEHFIIKKFIANDDCEYQYTGFDSTLKWKYFDNAGKYTIAIASQDWFTSKTLEVLEKLLMQLSNENINIVVFPHYRENERQYRGIKKRYPQLVIETGNRYANIELLITFYSTIVYDFWSVNSNLKVKCLKIPGYEPGYYGRENVSIYDDIDILIDDVLKEVNGEGNLCI